MTNDHIAEAVNMVDDPCDHVWRANATTQGAEFLGRWERIHNPKFNHLEFEVIELEAGRKALFVRHLTPPRKRWKIEAPCHPAHVFRYALEVRMTPYRLQSLNEFVPEVPLPDGADPASVLQLPSADIRCWSTANFSVGHDANHAEEYVCALHDYAIARERIITGDDALAEVGRSEELKTPGAQLLAAVMRVNHVTRVMDAHIRQRVNALIWGSIANDLAA